MTPLTLTIKRKMKVPTKYQLVHQFRSDWKMVYLLDKNQTKKLFKVGNGFIETDAQFCKWLKDNFGLGIYLILASRKGRKGFYNFMKVEVKNEGFRRLKKEKNKEEIQLKIEKAEFKDKLNKMSSENASYEDIEDEKKSFEEIQNLYEKDKKELDKKHGCHPYLNSIQPVYSFHGYEDYSNFDKEDTFIGRFV